jgi:hypothetical protein
MARQPRKPAGRPVVTAVAAVLARARGPFLRLLAVRLVNKARRGSMQGLLAAIESDVAGLPRADLLKLVANLAWTAGCVGRRWAPDAELDDFLRQVRELRGWDEAAGRQLWR